MHKKRPIRKEHDVVFVKKRHSWGIIVFIAKKSAYYLVKIDGVCSQWYAEDELVDLKIVNAVKRMKKLKRKKC